MRPLVRTAEFEVEGMAEKTFGNLEAGEKTRAGCGLCGGLAVHDWKINALGRVRTGAGVGGYSASLKDTGIPGIKDGSAARSL